MMVFILGSIIIGAVIFVLVAALQMSAFGGRADKVIPC